MSPSVSTEPGKAIKQVLAARNKADTEIYEKGKILQSRREHIKDLAYERPLNKGEIAELKEISAAMGALYDGSAELGLMTVIALEKLDEVKRLSNVVSAINSDLKSKLEDVTRIAKQLKKLGDLFKALQSVISGLAKLAVLLG